MQIANTADLTNASHSAALGAGDLIAIFTGLVYTSAGIWLQPSKRTVDGFGTLLASGISLGPLLLIFLDPFNELLHIFSANFFDLVWSSARITLWWAAGFTATSLLWPLFSKNVASV